jgi:hypothetical protein
MRTLLAIFLLFSCTPARAAADREQTFYPHLSTPAATAGAGEISFESFPGSNGLQSLFYNSLDIGIGPYFEIGTAPMFYLEKGNQYNINGKLNFYKTHDLHLAVGVSKFSFSIIDINGVSGVADTSQTVSITYAMFAADYFVPNSAFAFGVTLANPWISSNSAMLNTELDSKQKLEWFFDVACRLNQSFALTPGFGVLRLDTLDPLGSAVPFGYGATITWIRAKTATIKDIGVGLQRMPDVNKTSFLFNVTF